MIRRIIPALVFAVILTALPDCASATVLGAPKHKKKRAGSNILADDDSPSCTDIRKQFTVYAPRQDLAGELNRLAVQTRKSVYAFLNCARTWDAPAIIKIYPGQAEYNIDSGGDGTAGSTSYLSYQGKKTRLIIAFVDKDLKNTLRHEIVHLLVTDLANEGFFKGRDTERKVPCWIHEGIAEYIAASKARKAEYRELIYAAGRAGLLYPVEKIISFDEYPKNTYLFYAQAYSLVSFLGKNPDNALRLRNYITTSQVSGNDPKTRFLLAFHADFPDMKDLQDRWLKYTGTKYARDPKDWSARTLVGLAGTYMGFKRYEAAEKSAADGLKKDPKVESAHFILGMCAYKKGDLKKALNEFNEEDALAPKSYYISLMRGVVCKKLGMEYEAIAALTKAMDLNRDLRGLVIDEGGRCRVNEEAVEYFTRLLDD